MKGMVVSTIFAYFLNNMLNFVYFGLEFWILYFKYTNYIVQIFILLSD